MWIELRTARVKLASLRADANRVQLELPAAPRDTPAKLQGPAV